MSTPSDRSGPSTKAEGPRGTPARQEAPKDRPSVRPGGPESLVGSTLSGRYLIERLIGEGGMGAVYQAEHTHMRKRLAVKVLHPEMSRMSEVVQRFEREAMAAAHIDHPNVAAATDFGKLEDGSFFLVLEYVEGKSLREAQSDGRLELGRALHIARQIASALGRAHALGIVHRDLKPENVMLVTRDADPDFVKVLDFGIAKVPVGALGGDTASNKAPGQVLTQLGMVYGTPEYMAPEQALGQDVDLRADLYALGVMTFEMITGNRPFEHASKVTLLGMHVTAPVPSMSERAPEANVPPEVEAIVTRLLAKEATARFSDARELVEALDAVEAQLAARGRIAQPLMPPSSLGSPRPSLVDSNTSGPRAALASAPTSLAQPQSQARPGSLPSVVGATFGLTGTPSWSTQRWLAVGGGLFALVVVAAVVALVVTGEHEGGPVASASGSTSASATPPPPPPDPAVDEVVVAAQAKIDKGDFATAIDELTAVEFRPPDRADVHALLEKAYTGARNTAGAMREGGLWLAADPNAVADLKLQEDIRNAALMHDAQDDAFQLLESKMGMRGIDLLYDIGYGNSGKLYPQAAARARRSLDVQDIRGRASPALLVLLQFKDARSCDQKYQLLDDARDKADSRMTPMLQGYQGTRGCGFLSRADCWPCLHRDHLLQDALQAIADRAARAQ
jgi:eukaryotic-like serine/threonine-protein kinase